MKKVLFVAHVDSHIINFHIPCIKYFKDLGYAVHVASNGETAVPYADVKYNICFQKNPFSIKNVRAYKALKSIISKNSYDLIHCHTPVGGVLARLAAIKARRRGTKVLYTAHGFHFFKGSPFLSWLLFYPVELFLARYTDGLLTINHEDFTLAQRFRLAENGRVFYIPGVGVACADALPADDIACRRQETGIPQQAFFIVTVSDLRKRKNHKQALNAVSILKANGITHMLYGICGDGPYRKKLEKLCGKLDLDANVIFLGHRTDVGDILSCSDLFLFTTYQEGLSKALMEAMAAGLPAVATKIRGNTDLIEHGANGFLVGCDDAKKTAAYIELLMKSPDLCRQMGENNKKKVRAYDIDIVLGKMKEIYSLYLN